MNVFRQTGRVAIFSLCAICTFLLAAPGASGPAFASDSVPAAGAETAEVPPVTLRINEQLIPTDVAPLIVESRTLVPARAVFEALGGTVMWDDSGYPLQLVSVSCADAVVTLTVGAATALVNGAETPLDVPTQIVNDRTLIPVRFVSESLGFVVRWDEIGRVVDIYSLDYDIPPVLSAIEDIDATASSAGTRVTLSFSGPIPAYLADPNPPAPRLFSIGFPHTALLKEVSALEWQREISVLHGVRIDRRGGAADDVQTEQGTPQGETAPQVDAAPQGGSQVEALPQTGGPLVSSAPADAAPQTVGSADAAPESERATADAAPESKQAADAAAAELWFVFELSEDAVPALSADGNTLFIDFPKPQFPFDPWADGKLSAVLDPGHGAETIGKRSPDDSLLEYAFNRDMAARVRAHLERHGVETLLTVTDDTDLPLEERCNIANASGADVFVSLHANAYGNGKAWTKQSGWEIYVYKEGSFSDRLAKSVHGEAIPAIGLADRGVKAERYYVIRNVNMPAVLIEHGFYTNKTEIELLKSPEFRERLAVADAKGILRFLGVAWSEPAA
jgi:N-acetylmuramoyl-L-alanine amidase